MAIITRKIELYLHKGDNTKEQTDEQWAYWNNINDNLYKAANRITSHLFFNDEYTNRLRVQSKEYETIKKKKEKDLSDEDKEERKKLNTQFRKDTQTFLGTSEQNSTYKVASDEFLDVIPSEILTNLNQSIVSTYKEKQKEIRFGKATLSNYKKGLPVPFALSGKDAKRLEKREDGNIYLNWIKGIVWYLHFGRDRSNNREIVEKAISGEYKLCNSFIQQKDKKIFLLLVVDIPQKSNSLSKDIIVGVDLGINVPLYAATNNNEYGGFSIGSREQFIKVRERMYAKKKELQRTLRSSTNGGKGRGKKLQALERFAEKERNWVKAQNHIFSSELIKYALGQKAGIIQMEGLGGFGKDKEDNVQEGFKYIVRYWSYFELQTMIEYKAKANSIEVRYINPYHTSQNCSFCGHWEAGQRITQSKFVCKNPDCTKGKGELKNNVYEGINADWNAARNIAKSIDFVAKSQKSNKFAKKEE